MGITLLGELKKLKYNESVILCLTNRSHIKYFKKTKTMSKNKFTWNDLSKAISKLPENVRKKEVCVSIEDEVVFRKISGLETTKDDVYFNLEDHDDCGSLEDLKEIHGCDFNKSDYKLSTKKGFPYLWDGN